MDQSNGKAQDAKRLGLSAEELLAFAEAAGLTEVDQTALMTFALSIAEECAEIGDRYSKNNGNCGDEIRSRFGLG